ncbi:outer membrane protein [Pelagibius sp. Alg239-R121]|uniref:outer membrane protein n=1 Tax=Pelagibius sp. Alg239-R121 TaxID=2993448 RepID=UPI0024A63F6C|nr:outer membrane beta-barrel protein [Pelagibius sp. Alg239-R121]
MRYINKTSLGINRCLCLLSILLMIVPALMVDIKAATARQEDGSYSNWQGIYIGANAGWGIAYSNLSPTCTDALDVEDGPFCINVPGSSSEGDGFSGGGQVGYNYLIDRSIIGFEFDLQHSSIEVAESNDSQFDLFYGIPAFTRPLFTTTAEWKWLGTARLRLGHIVSDRLMVYGTGGTAFGGIEISSDFVNTGPTASFYPYQYPASKDIVEIGWTAGAGLEYALSKNWSVKLDALYVDLGEADISSGCGPNCIAGPSEFSRGVDLDLRSAMIRVGINWRF